LVGGFVFASALRYLLHSLLRFGKTYVFADLLKAEQDLYDEKDRHDEDVIY